MDSARPRIQRALTLGAVLVAAGAIASCGGSSKKAGGVKGASEIRAEPVSTAGANPFTAAVGKDAGGVKPPAAAVSTGGGLPTYNASLPGLYGGTRNHATCDADKLVYFLEHNPAKATAWASTLGITRTKIRDYVSGLTAVTLRTDTRVTNHGYVGGRANPIQAVLEAGTAVFVNKYGEPVVKCYCGNPLTGPVLYKEPTYYGPRWSGFDSSHITIINKSTTIIKIFNIYDLKTGKTFPRQPGLGGTDGPYTGTAPSTPAAPSGPSTTTTPPSTQAENPSASFSPNPGHQGDTFTLSASGFKPGATVDVTLVRPDKVVESYSISIGADGSGSHTFTNTGNGVLGVYQAELTNAATGAQAHASVEVLAAGP